MIRQNICDEAGITNCNIGTSGQTSFNCGANKSSLPALPSFFIVFADYYFEVQPEDYIQLTGEGASTCLLRLVGDDDIGGVGTANTWNLGLAFMNGYYTIHKYDTNVVGIAPHYFSTKQPPECTTVAACGFTIEQNVIENVETTVGGSVTVINGVDNVSEWALVTVGLAGSTILGIMLIAYILCPSILGGKRKSSYVLSHHSDNTMRVLKESNIPIQETNHLEIVFLQ